MFCLFFLHLLHDVQNFLKDDLGRLYQALTTNALQFDFPSLGCVYSGHLDEQSSTTDASQLLNIYIKDPECSIAGLFVIWACCVQFVSSFTEITLKLYEPAG